MSITPLDSVANSASTFCSSINVGSLAKTTHETVKVKCRSSQDVLKLLENKSKPVEQPFSVDDSKNGNISPHLVLGSKNVDTHSLDGAVRYLRYH